MPASQPRVAAAGFLLVMAAGLVWAQQGSGCLAGARPGEVEGMLSRGEFAQAAQMLERALAKGGSCDAETWLMLAVSYQNLGKGDRAFSACARGLKFFPKSERLQEYYGAVVVEGRSRAEALARLEEAVRAQPDAAPLRKTLGRLLFDPPTDDPKAGEHLAAAARLRPKDPEARYFHGLWACTKAAAWADLAGRRLPVVQESYELCLRELAQALTLTPPGNDQAVMQIHANIGSAEEALGRTDNARQAFRKALEANRRLSTPNPAVALEYARFLLRGSENAEAKAILNEILASDQRNAPARFERARVALDEGMTELAIEDARLALRDAQQDTALLRRIHSFLARTYHETGREDEADRHRRWFEPQRGVR